MALGVGIHVSDYLAPRSFETGVAGGGEPLVGQSDHLDRVPTGQCEGAVSGSVVAVDDLHRRVVAGDEGSQAPVYVGIDVVTADDGRDCRPPGPQVRQVAPGPFGYRVQAELGRAVTVGQPEAPAVDRVTCHDPVICPAEDCGTRAATLVDCAQLAIERVSLGKLAVDLGSQTQLRHQYGQGTRDDLQVAQVGSQQLRSLQEDVEADQVLALHLQVLGGGVVAVGGQHVRVGLVHLIDEPRQRVLDGADAMDSHQVSGDLVADSDPQDGVAALASFDGALHSPPARVQDSPASLAAGLGN